jgi:hypothetical protein
MLLRMFNALNVIFSGQAFGRRDTPEQNRDNPNRRDNHFDDYEEVD